MFYYFLFYLGFGGGVILFYYGCYCGYFYIVGYEVIRKKVREEWIIKVKFWMFVIDVFWLLFILKVDWKEKLGKVLYLNVKSF